MNDCESVLTDCLSDAGFDRDAVAQAVGLYKVGSKEALKKYLRARRCDLIEQMHENQKKIDRVDYAIRQTEKL